MEEFEKIRPQIYLITPSEIELSTYPALLKSCLDTVDVACVRLALSSTDENHIAKAADACREICHSFDVAMVIDSHIQMVERLGLDGVHLTDGSRNVRSVRKELGADAIVGAHCGVTRHDGMNAAEAGCDYVSLGPVGASALGDGTVAEFDTFEWWSQMIEVPVVAEGSLTSQLVAKLSPVTDFFGIGDEIWNSDDPAAALRALDAEID